MRSLTGKGMHCCCFLSTPLDLQGNIVIHVGLTWTKAWASLEYYNLPYYCTGAHQCCFLGDPVVGICCCEHLPWLPMRAVLRADDSGLYVTPISQGGCQCHTLLIAALFLHLPPHHEILNFANKLNISFMLPPVLEGLSSWQGTLRPSWGVTDTLFSLPLFQLLVSDVKQGNPAMWEGVFNLQVCMGQAMSWGFILNSNFP